MGEKIDKKSTEKIKNSIGKKMEDRNKCEEEKGQRKCQHYLNYVCTYVRAYVPVGEFHDAL